MKTPIKKCRHKSVEVLMHRLYVREMIAPKKYRFVSAGLWKCPDCGQVKTDE